MLALVRAANQLGVPVIVVTNQSGIGRGYYDWAGFAAVQRVLNDALAKAGGMLDLLLACPARPDESSAYRKPAPGMLHLAAELLPLDLAASWMVGDSASDLEAARRAGLARGFLLGTGHGEQEEAAALVLATATFPVKTQATAEQVMAAFDVLTRAP
jgi:D-glycero-D-manno-heptose 1,7-bisphosphate phosphatase